MALTTAPSGPVTVSAPTLAVEEDHATAGSAPYTVELATEPTGPVTVGGRCR